jgi:tetratricopeptide (TPR) repeat protein
VFLANHTPHYMDPALGYPLEPPISTGIQLPLNTSAQELPIEQLSWENFERLCLRLVQTKHALENCEVYGIKGQKQHGIDIFAKNFGGKYATYQCKRYESMTPSTLRKAVKTFTQGKWAEKSKEFTICTTLALNSARLQDTFNDLRDELGEQGIILVKWDRVQLQRMLKNHPEIVHDFFGIDWARVYNITIVAGNANTTLIHNLPYLGLDNLFKGRTSYMLTLQEKSLAGKTKVVLYGLGGIGKTRLAVEYAWQLQAQSVALLFVRADSPTILKAGLADLCNPLLLNLPEYTKEEQDVKIGAVVRWLRDTPKWLLIFDNVDTPEAIREVEKLLPVLVGGNVLITSRISEWGKQVEKLQVGVLDQTDAVLFLLDRTADGRQSTSDDVAEAGILANHLGGLALALEQAGAYIKNRRITIQEYCRRWKTNETAVHEWFDEQLTDYACSVAVTWQTSFEQLSNASKILLGYLAWLATEPVPRSSIKEVKFSDELLDIEKAVADLARYSLITYTTDGSAFSMHQLVQDASRSYLGEDGKQYFAKVLQWLDDEFARDLDDVRTWPLRDALQLHALRITEHAIEFQNPSPTARLLSQLGRFLRIKARTDEAEILIRQAVQISETNPDLNHAELVHSLTEQVHLLIDIDRSKDAEFIMRRIIKINDDYRKSDLYNVSIGLNNLALALQNSDDLQKIIESENLHRKVLKIRIDIFGPKTNEVAVVKSGLAGVLHKKVVLQKLDNIDKTSILKEAEILLRESIDVAQIFYGVNDLKVASRSGSLAVILRLIDDVAYYKEIEELYCTALRINEEHHGSDHTSVANIYGNLAVFLQKSGYSDKAESAYIQAMRIFSEYEKITGHKHTNYKFVIENYSLLLNKIGLSKNEIADRIQAVIN